MSGILTVAGKLAALFVGFGGSGGDLIDGVEWRDPIEVDDMFSPFREGLELFLLKRPILWPVVGRRGVSWPIDCDTAAVNARPAVDHTFDTIEEILRSGADV